MFYCNVVSCSKLYTEYVHNELLCGFQILMKINKNVHLK